MNSDLVIILDQALKFALLGFLVAYLILLLYSRAKLRGQRRKLEDIYMEVAEGVPSLQSDRLPFSGALFDQWRISLKAFYEGFSVKGEVWNQTAEPFNQLQVVIRVIGTDGQPLEEVTIPVEPVPLEPGAAGLFELNYTQNSPFISGYQVAFFDQTGKAIPHVFGFDVD